MSREARSGPLAGVARDGFESHERQELDFCIAARHLLPSVRHSTSSSTIQYLDKRRATSTLLGPSGTRPSLCSLRFFSCSFHLTFCSSLQRITRSILHLNNADGIRVKRTHPMYQCFPKGVRKHKRCSPLPKCLLSYHGCTTTFGQFAGKASVGIKGKDRGQNAFTCVCFRRARR
jgi:hypothetical protein